MYSVITQYKAPLGIPKLNDDFFLFNIIVPHYLLLVFSGRFGAKGLDSLLSLLCSLVEACSPGIEPTFISVITTEPLLMPLVLSVFVPSFKPISMACALNTLPSRVQTLFLPLQSTILSSGPTSSFVGVKRRALLGTQRTPFFSNVYMVTLAVSPGFSLRFLLGALITTSYVTTLFVVVASCLT